jgi:methionine-rich copper-binding protein CopC
MPTSAATTDTTTAASLPLQSGPGDDHPDTSGDNTVIVIGGTAQAGVIGVTADIDRFRVELSAGTSYRFELNSGINGLGSRQLVLLGSSGSAIASDVGGGKDGAPQISYTATSSGTYYLDATGRNGSTGSFTVLAVETSAMPDPDSNDDYPARNDTTGVVVPSGAAVQGVLERIGDVDYFKVVLEANATYTFSLQGSGGLQDTVLRLHAGDGRVLTSDDDGSGTKNGGSKISFTATTSGVYYLDASSDVSQSGAYTLQAVQTSTPPSDDFPATINTAGVVVPNGAAAQGQLERVGDVDYFKVVLEANAVYTFSLQGSGNGLQDTVLRLHAEDGRVLASDDDGSGALHGSSKISFTPPSSGTYYLDVSSDAGQRGTYGLRAAMDDYAASTATAGRLTVDGTATRGVLESPGDVDWLRVDLRSGVLYQLDIGGAPSNTGGTALASPGLSVKTADGNTLNTGGKGGAERLSFVAPADGTYYINVEARDRTAIGTYAVRATTLPDDYPSSFATTGVVQVNGSLTTGRIDAPTDVDHFKVQLVEGSSYTFSLSGTDGSGSLVDTLLRVRGADGKELAANDDAGSKNSGSRLTFTAPSSGTYYLEAAGDGKLVGGYSLSALSMPALTGATPANGATNVARSANVVLTFDRPVQANQGHVSIATPDGAVAASINLGDTSQVTIDGRVVTINPAHDLVADRRYVVNIADGALKDANGNPLAGLGDALSFTTLAGNRVPSADHHAFPAVPGSVATGRLPTAVDADGDSVTYQLETPPKQGTIVIEADGRFTYEPGLWFTGIDEFRFSVRDSQGASGLYAATVTMAALPVVQGTAQADALAAAPGANRYVGLDGNDGITTGPATDVVDAGPGIDTVAVSAARGDVTLQRRLDGGWTLGSQASGTDHLFEVERLQFTDRSTALDLAGTAGQAARVVGAVLGTAQLKDAALIGRYLSLADSGVGGEQVVHQVLADPLFTSLAGSLSNEDVVTHVYTNIVGKAPSAGEVTYYSGLITGGQYTQDSLLWWAASLDATAQRIDLAGLATHGLDFLQA